MQCNAKLYPTPEYKPWITLYSALLDSPGLLWQSPLCEALAFGRTPTVRSDMVYRLHIYSGVVRDVFLRVRLRPGGATRTPRCDLSSAVRLDSGGATRVFRCDSNSQVRLELAGATCRASSGDARVEGLADVCAGATHFGAQVRLTRNRRPCASTRRIKVRHSSQCLQRFQGWVWGSKVR